MTGNRRSHAPAGRARRLACVAGLALLASGVGTDASAQTDSTGRLQGLVGKVGTTQRIANAEVFLDGVAAALTKTNGTFELTGLQPGQHHLTIRTVGYRPARFIVMVKPRQVTSLQIGLEEGANTLEGVVVEGVGVRPRPFAHVEARERQGIGDFIWREEFERRGMRSMSQALQMTGKVDFAVVASDATGGRTLTIVTMGHGIRTCVPVIYLDGVRYEFAEQQIDDMFDLDTIEAIEVFDHFEVPAELGGSGQGCGVISLWTRIE